MIVVERVTIAFFASTEIFLDNLDSNRFKVWSLECIGLENFGVAALAKQNV